MSRNITPTYNLTLENSYIINVGIDESLSNNLNFFALSTELPGMSIGVAEAFGPSNVIRKKIYNQQPDYEPLVIQFFIDEDWEVPLFFYNLMVETVDEFCKQNIKLDETFTLTIYVTDNKKSPIVAYRFYDTKMVGFTGVNRTSNIEDTTYPVMDVTFDYSYFRMERC